MGTWLAIEAMFALLTVLLWGAPSPAEPIPDCDRPAVEVECGDAGGER